MKRERVVMKKLNIFSIFLAWLMVMACASAAVQPTPAWIPSMGGARCLILESPGVVDLESTLLVAA
jgi:hypothetical protein